MCPRDLKLASQRGSSLPSSTFPSSPPGSSGLGRRGPPRRGLGAGILGPWAASVQARIQSPTPAFPRDASVTEICHCRRNSPFRIGMGVSDLSDKTSPSLFTSFQSPRVSQRAQPSEAGCPGRFRDRCVFEIPLVLWGKVHLIVFLCPRPALLSAAFLAGHKDPANCLLVSVNSRGREDILENTESSSGSVWKCVSENSV